MSNPHPTPEALDAGALEELVARELAPRAWLSFDGGAPDTSSMREARAVSRKNARVAIETINSLTARPAPSAAPVRGEEAGDPICPMCASSEGEWPPHLQHCTCGKYPPVAAAPVLPEEVAGLVTEFQTNADRLERDIIWGEVNEAIYREKVKRLRLAADTLARLSTELQRERERNTVEPSAEVDLDARAIAMRALFGSKEFPADPEMLGESYSYRISVPTLTRAITPLLLSRLQSAERERDEQSSRPAPATERTCAHFTSHRGCLLHERGWTPDAKPERCAGCPNAASDFRDLLAALREIKAARKERDELLENLIAGNKRSEVAEARAQEATERAERAEAALKEARIWRQAQHKALSKQPGATTQHAWQREQHREQIEALDAALSDQPTPGEQA